MRCAGKSLAVGAAALLLAACSGGAGAARTAGGGPGGRAGRAAAIARQHARGVPGAILVSPARGGAWGTGGAPEIVFSAGPAGGPGGRPPVTVGRIPPVTATRPIVMPLDSYELISSQEQTTLAATAILLTQRCMAARGFVYTQASAADNGLASMQPIETGSLGLTSMSQAQAYGYATPGGSGGGQGPGLTVLAEGTAGGFLPPAFDGGPGGGSGPGQHATAWIAALNGSGSQPGCLRQANAVLYGSAGGGDPLTTLAFQAAGWAQNDPRVKQVFQAWSACMAGRGFRYAQPIAAAVHRWPKKPTRTEIATAVADVTCKRQVNLVNTMLSVEAAYQQALVNQDMAQLSGLQSDYAGVLQRASDLLAAPAAP